jgi:hypothetical protein
LRALCGSMFAHTLKPSRSLCVRLCVRMCVCVCVCVRVCVCVCVGG